MCFPFLNYNLSDETYEGKILLFNDEFYVFKYLDLKSRNRIWNLVLDRIEEVSNELKYEKDEFIIKGLMIPRDILEEKQGNFLMLRFDNDKQKIRSFIYKQNIFEGNKVILVDEDVTKIRQYYIYKVVSMKEEVLILEKTDMIINKKEEANIISKIGDEIKNGY
jgi:hypothetical protein